MVLPSKTIELIEQIADTLDNWPNENQKWNNKIIKDKPENLQSEISEKLDYILEELQHYMPDSVERVQEKKKKLVRGVGRVCYPGMASYKSSRRCIISRYDATALAKTLRHIAEMAREDTLSEKPRETKESTIPDDMVQIYVELNLAERLLIIGTDECRISSVSVWDFLKTLACNTKMDQITPRIDRDRNWKNAVDVLRRKIGNDALRQVVTFAKGGYYLAASVKTKYSSQVGIRRTKKKDKNKKRKRSMKSPSNTQAMHKRQ